MKIQLNFKSGNTQVSDDDTATQIQVSGFVAVAVILASVVFIYFVVFFN